MIRMRASEIHARCIFHRVCDVYATYETLPLPRYTSRHFLPVDEHLSIALPSHSPSRYYRVSVTELFCADRYFCTAARKARRDDIGFRSSLIGCLRARSLQVDYFVRDRTHDDRLTCRFRRFASEYNVARITLARRIETNASKAMENNADTKADEKERRKRSSTKQPRGDAEPDARAGRSQCDVDK